MKKIIIYSIVALTLLYCFGFKPTVEITADSEYVEMPNEINLSEEETTFEIKLIKKLDDSQRIKIVLNNINKLTSEKNEEEKLDIKVSNYYLTNTNPSSAITIKHNKLVYRNWRSDLDIKFILEETIKTNKTKTITNKEDETKTINTSKEEKIMYTYQTVTGWDEVNYLLDKPSGIYEERTQYGTSIASFDESNYSLDIPSDGFYKTSIQYGYNQRTKKEVSVPYTATRNVFYNNVGSCPMDCISGTINDYGTGCECTIVESYTDYKKSYSYSSWETNNDSWRFNDSYSSSDIVQPITRNIYLIPTSWSEVSDWSYESKTPTNETKVEERTVYVTPSSYSEESSYQDSVPGGTNIKINTYHFYRIVTNGVPGEWIRY